MDSLSLLAVSAFMLFPTALFQLSNGGVTSSFIRKSKPSVDMPFDADVFQPPPGYNSPQQVRIMQGDHEGKAVIVSWVTPSERGSRVVFYGMAEEKRRYKAHASLDVRVGAESERTNVRPLGVSDGRGLLPCLVGSPIASTTQSSDPMMTMAADPSSPMTSSTTISTVCHDTEYFYQIGIDESSRQFSFKTPPAVGPDVPYTFGITGDLGQTYNSNETLSHYLAN
ncbi:Purple acid phosphatase 10 [Acorus calamus]|uniref:Purple acid phosphatase 10 n=1 Tax=Acorus calamus TaxID=4465 RepID=A0AAV9C3K8_ACOCL|nr:Purple acid phosphatase 10 [Acorus calamus]